jgi:hypothetical protein
MPKSHEEIIQEFPIQGLVDSTSKCDKSEEGAAQTFLFRRKPHVPMAYGFASKQKCLFLCKSLLANIMFCRTSNLNSQLVTNWYFRVREVSNAVFRVEGSDIYGRTVSRIGTETDSQKMLDECVAYAKQIQTEVKSA